jgi:hypothetical protein
MNLAYSIADFTDESSVAVALVDTPRQGEALYAVSVAPAGDEEKCRSASKLTSRSPPRRLLDPLSRGRLRKALA